MTVIRLKLLTILVCALATLASGCGQQSSPAPATETAASAPAQSAPASPAAAPAASPGDEPDSAASPAEEAVRQGGLPPGVVAQKWTGDLDGMIERRVIRVLTTYSKTNYFVDRGTQRGLVYDAFQIFETELNKKLENKHIRVYVGFIPVANDELIPALLDGRGDIVAAGKLATEWRKQSVDFTKPTRTGISSVIVTGPGAPPIKTVEDLGGKELYLRQSDVSGDGVKRFNEQLAKAGKPPATLKPAPEVLADEDILEMVNAGLVPITITDDETAEFWKQVFPDLTVNESAAVRTDGEKAMMIRKNSPQLMQELNAFIDRFGKGSAQGNMLLQKYLKSAKYAKQATKGADVARFQKTIDLIRKYSGQYDLDYLLMA